MFNKLNISTTQQYQELLDDNKKVKHELKKVKSSYKKLKASTQPNEQISNKSMELDDFIKMNKINEKNYRIEVEISKLRMEKTH